MIVATQNQCFVPIVKPLTAAFAFVQAAAICLAATKQKAL